MVFHNTIFSMCLEKDNNQYVHMYTSNGSHKQQQGLWLEKRKSSSESIFRYKDHRNDKTINVLLQLGVFEVFKFIFQDPDPHTYSIAYLWNYPR